MDERMIGDRLLSKITEIRNKYNRVKIICKVGNYGYLISKEEISYSINKKGKKVEQSHTVYNILEKDGSLACEKWFNKYSIDKTGDCIIGYLKTHDEKVKNTPLEKQSIYRYGAINERGCLSVKPYYESIAFASEDTYIVGANGKYGYVDRGTGLELTPVLFTESYDFIDGIARVKVPKTDLRKISLYGYINRYQIITDIDNDDEYAISPQFIFARDFHDGLAKVQSLYNDEEHCIDSSNHEIDEQTLKLKK